MLRRNNNSPIIVVGMHRSGTTMLVRALELMGVFMGKDQEHNAESKFFISLNEWLLNQASCSWDRPLNLQFLRNDDELIGLLREYLKFFISSPKKFAYTGTKYLLGSDIPWGWKDPRNTFTARFWLDIYPNAKVIIVERQGLDVATSLITRRNKYLKIARTRFPWIKYLYLVRPNKYPFGSSSLVRDIDGGIDLWHKYLIEGRKLAASHPSQTFILNYENLLTNSKHEIEKIYKFLDLPKNLDHTEHVKKIIDTFDPTRANRAVIHNIEASPESMKKLACY